MNAAAKLAAFAAVVATGFGGAAAVGAAVGPIDTSSDSAAHSSHGPGEWDESGLPRGLAVAQAGVRLVLDSTRVAAAAPSTFGFTIVDDEGTAVTAFDELHERPLHLIVLSRNMVDYLHLHPTMDPAGHWTVDVPSLRAGSYRVFADFQPAGSPNITLGADVSVAGDVGDISPPPPADVTTVDGYTVTIDGTPSIGDSELHFTVVLDGQAVQTEPYLGAAGHLVAVREGDLAYLHVHPHDDEGETPVVTFTGEFPSAGTYRLFFDFSHDGTVRTASFTVDVPAGDHGATMASHEEGN